MAYTFLGFALGPHFLMASKMADTNPVVIANLLDLPPELLLQIAKCMPSLPTTNDL